MNCRHPKPKLLYSAILLILLTISEQHTIYAAEANALINNKTDRPTPKGNKNYLVKSGDTLYSIGLRTGHGYQNLALWNHLSPPHKIFVGQSIKLFNPAETTKNLEPPKIIPINNVNYAAVAPAKGNLSPNLIVLKKQPDGSVVQIRPDSIKKANRPPPETKPVIEQSKKNSSAKNPADKPAHASVSTGKEKHVAEIIVIKKPVSPAVTQNSPDINKNSVISISNKKMLKLSFKWPIKGKAFKSFSGSNIQGIDITNKNGKQPVAAAEAGQVVYIGPGLNDLKNLIIIKHNDVYLSAYANNNRPVVKEGQQVKSGQAIAEIGTAENKKISLHFEIRQNGKPVNPLNLLSK